MVIANNLNITSSDYGEELQKCQEYVHALEEERLKIQVFQRELPLCLELVTQGTRTCLELVTQVFQREKSVGGVASCKAAAASSSVETGGGSGADGGGECKKEEKEGENQRKQRRCWSAELHRRFLQALQQLGGSHVATPKQIRELMKVGGVTNDEVKSHLQKYRLHTRRPTPSMHNTTTQQAPQFVVVGGIWVPPPEFAAMPVTTSHTEEAPRPAVPKGIYAPIASHPPNASMSSSNQRQQHEKCSSDDHGSHSKNGSASHSAATSSSDTTTASPSGY